jgi:hypothetical protein
VHEGIKKRILINKRGRREMIPPKTSGWLTYRKEGYVFRSRLGGDFEKKIIPRPA